LIHTQQRLSQLYALYTVNVASSPYSTKTNDPLIDTLLSNGIQPVDFSSIPADAVPASMLKGLDATSAARIDDYVSSKLKETAMTLKGLEETVRARYVDGIANVGLKRLIPLCPHQASMPLLTFSF